VANELQNSGYISAANINTNTGSTAQGVLNYVSTVRRGIKRTLLRSQNVSQLPISGPQSASSTIQLHKPGPGCKFLHLCVEKGRYCTRMHHIDVCDHKTDRAIFDTLRKDYKKIRKELNSLLFKIHRIDFVEVERSKEFPSFAFS
jgi:hypothetical protein